MKLLEGLDKSSKKNVLYFFRITHEKTVLQDKTDIELLSLFDINVNQDALVALYNRYTAQIFGVCLKYLKSKERAKDASLEIYQILLRRIPGKTIKHFKSWLYTLTKNYCLEQLRSDNNKFLKQKDADFMYSKEVFHLTTYKEDPKLKMLSVCLGQLKEIQAACVKAFYLEEKTYDQIAVDLNIPWNKVRSNIQNGKRNIKNCINSQ